MSLRKKHQPPAACRAERGWTAVLGRNRTHPNTVGEHNLQTTCGQDKVSPQDVAGAKCLDHYRDGLDTESEDAFSCATHPPGLLRYSLLIYQGVTPHEPACAAALKGHEIPRARLSGDLKTDGLTDCSFAVLRRGEQKGLVTLPGGHNDENC